MEEEEGSDNPCYPCSCLFQFYFGVVPTKIPILDDNLVNNTLYSGKNPRIPFDFKILQCTQSDDGGIEEVIAEEFYHDMDWVFFCDDDQFNFSIITNEACHIILYQLMRSGMCSTCINQVLQKIISDAKPVLFNPRKYISENLQEMLSLCLFKIVSIYKPGPATKESIEALKKVKFEDGVSDSMQTCVICSEDLWQEITALTTMEVTALPCSHLFHGNCIVKWLNTSHTCPLCRYKMPTLFS